MHRDVELPSCHLITLAMIARYGHIRQTHTFRCGLVVVLRCRGRLYDSRYFDAAASRLIAADIARTRAASFAPSHPRRPPPRARSAPPRAAPVCFSAASSALAIAVVRSAARPLSRTSWSRYDRTTGNAAGHTIFGWLCGLYSREPHQLRRRDLVRRELVARHAARGCRSRASSSDE